MSFHPELFCKIAELPFNDNGFFSKKKGALRKKFSLSHRYSGTEILIVIKIPDKYPLKSPIMKIKMLYAAEVS